MLYTQSFVFKRSLLVILILVCLGIAIYPWLSAQVGARNCQANLVVYLQDGSTITLTTQIATDTAYVQKIQYTLHVPRGAALKEVVNTPGELGKHETVTVVADNDPGIFTSSTLVRVIATQVPVTTTLAVQGGYSALVRGYTNQSLVVSNQ